MSFVKQKNHVVTQLVQWDGFEAHEASWENAEDFVILKLSIPLLLYPKDLRQVFFKGGSMLEDRMKEIVKVYF